MYCGHMEMDSIHLALYRLFNLETGISYLEQGSSHLKMVSSRLLKEL